MRDWCTWLLFAAFMFFVGAIANLSKVHDDLQRDRDMSGPLFIAHGCEGAGGDLWATDISDFPTSCKEIERAVP